VSRRFALCVCSLCFLSDGSTSLWTPSKAILKGRLTYESGMKNRPSAKAALSSLEQEYITTFMRLKKN